VLGVIGVLYVASASFAALPPQWNPAIQVDGTATTGTLVGNRGYADVRAVSCATPGNCAAGGFYTNQWGGEVAFLVDETNGTWDTAFEVPGTLTPHTTQLADVSSISCSSPGNCVAAGSYFAWEGPAPFVVEEVDGTWGTAHPLPGMTTLNNGGNGGSVASISCPSDGNCTVGGTYSEHVPHANNAQAFVADETNGTWGNAIKVPGMAGLGAVDSRMSSLSCSSAGNCAAVGYFDGKAFVVDEKNGSWHNAIQVPGTAALQGTGGSWLYSVSCPTDGNCSAGGSYGQLTEDGGDTQPFVVDETNGTWGTAIEVPAAQNLNHGLAQVETISCGAAGSCAAGGYYTDGGGTTQAFVVDETNGSWGSAIELPGTAGLNYTKYRDRVESISCAAAGSCVAAGYYDGTEDTFHGSSHAYVASETNGIWANAIQLPGLAALDTGHGSVALAVSCVSAHDCAAGGTYQDSLGNHQAFVSSSTQVDATTLVPDDVGGVLGGTTNLTATLTSGGNGVVGATVSFTLNGASLGSATTDVNGVATLQNVDLSGIAVGTYPDAVGASFDGDDNPASASSGSSALTVYPAGLVGQVGVSVNGSTSGATIDSFDSSRGAYGPTNHGSDALVMSNGSPGFAGVKVYGGATSTRGGVTVASTARITGNIRAATTASIQGTVGGKVTEHAPSPAFSRPTVAACKPFSSKKGISGGTFMYSTRTGDLTVTRGTVKLANGTYCFHTITMSIGTLLTVSGPVTLNLTGKIAGPSGHIVNTTKDPTKLRINTSYNGTGGVLLQGSSQGYMTILAPATSVTISGGSYFGTLFAGTVSLKGSATFHADTP
jgi:hypothetical protein